MEIKPEEVLTQKLARDAQISPDGELVAFTLGDSYKEETSKPKSDIWLADVRKGMVRQFTAGGRTDNSPRWSPDGTRLAFLSDRLENGKFQIFVMAREGGEAIGLTSVRGRITQLAWSPAGDRIAFLMYDPETEEDRARAETTGGATEFERHHKFERIWTLDVKTKLLKRITGDYQVWEFCWSPDGRRFAAVIADEPYEWTWHISRLAVIPVNTGRPLVVYAPKTKQLGGLLWSPEGDSIYFISAILSDRPLLGGDLFRISAAGGGKEPVNVTNDRLGSVHCAKWHSRDELIILSVDMAKTFFTLMTASGAEEGKFTTVYEGEVGIVGGLEHAAQPSFSASGDGRSIAVVREDLRSPQEVWLGELSRERMTLRQLTESNESLKKYSGIASELIEWTSFDGLKIQGFLYLPPGRKREGLPLVVHEHGGPSFGYGYRFEMDARYYASHGYAVLDPNPRGSMGRGTRFLEANRGDLDGNDFKDIMAGVDYCVDRGWVDPKKLFVFGGSYGGYLVAWTVSHTTRFNAAVMDYGICNLLSCHGTEWNTYWEVFQFDIDPYTQSDLFDKRSAIYYVRNVKTPTLIIHGEEDPCVPVGQGHEFFRALKELGVETELVIYPREGHGWQERKHQIDSFRRHLAWFDQHMNKRKS